MPTCKRCGEGHYNFVSCDKAREKREQEQAKPKRKPLIVYKSDRDREFGDRLKTVQVSGQTYWRKRDVG